MQTTVVPRRDRCRRCSIRCASPAGSRPAVGSSSRSSRGRLSSSRATLSRFLWPPLRTATGSSACPARATRSNARPTASTIPPAPGPRPAATAILFLLAPGERSAPHVVDADELWLWHGPGALALRVGGERVVLGVDRPQVLVPAGVEQSTEPAAQEVLVSCVVSPGFEWAGVKQVTRKAEWPDWRPPAEMLKRRPDLSTFMKGGPENPLGARALYLGSSLYRIHGTNEPWTIGQNVSSGCIRMMNDDVTDLYQRVRVGERASS